jgi:hypothetical protein
MMKTPVVIVAVALTVAILLVASLVIATETRGGDGKAALGDGKAALSSISFDSKIRKAAPIQSAAF